MILNYSSSLRTLAHEVLMAGRQGYTPEQIQEIPNILNTKASYFFGVDLCDEVLLMDVFTTEGFKTYWQGNLGNTEKTKQIAQNLIICDNDKMVPSHYGHNQVVRFIDETHVQLLTRMQDYHTYKDDE